MTHASRNTTTGLLFEQHTKGEGIGIPLHKKELRKYYTEKTKKYLCPLYGASKQKQRATG